MVVLIEGPDGTGKSTLAKVFTDRYGFNYIHLGPQADIEETYKKLIGTLKASKNDTVIDRAILSNEVYSEIYGGTVLSDKKYAEMIHLVDRVIMCLPKDKDKYLKEFDKLKGEREELYKSGMEKVYNLFSRYKGVSRYDRFEVEDVNNYVDSFIQSNRK